MLTKEQIKALALKNANQSATRHPKNERRLLSKDVLEKHNREPYEGNLPDDEELRYRARKGIDYARAMIARIDTKKD